MNITDCNRIDNLKANFADLIFKNENISAVDKINMSYDVVLKLDELSFRIKQLEDEIEENQSIIKHLQDLLIDAHIPDGIVNKPRGKRAFTNLIDDDLPSFGDEKKEPACNKLFKSAKEAIDRLNDVFEGGGEGKEILEK